MRQRAMIAIALACNPEVLLADEPTTALDVTVQAQILYLLRELQARLGMAVIFVTHDLGVAAEVADDVAVMYAGRIVEYGPVRQVLQQPAHPYTQGLMNATVHRGQKGHKLIPIPGQPPDLTRLPAGCSLPPVSVGTGALYRGVPKNIGSPQSIWRGAFCSKPRLRPVERHGPKGGTYGAVDASQSTKTLLLLTMLGLLGTLFCYPAAAQGAVGCCASA